MSQAIECPCTGEVERFTRGADSNAMSGTAPLGAAPLSDGVAVNGGLGYSGGAGRQARSLLRGAPGQAPRTLRPPRRPSRTHPNEPRGHPTPRWRAIRAKVHARRSRFDEAERLARESVALAESSDFLIAHADAVADLSEVLELAGRMDEAARAIEDATELYESKGNSLAAATCRERLRALR
jgi:tetratricopeptide (TPR) repeat protein